METVRCLSVPGPVSSGQFLVENTCPARDQEEQDRTSRQDCDQTGQTEVWQELNITDQPVPGHSAPLSVRDELDNQVITVTNGEASKISESPPAEDIKEELELTHKRKQIGDEFYREAEAESEGEARIVKLTTSIITVSADSLEAIPTSVLAGSNKTPTIVSTQAFLASSLESELNQKLQEQILSDGSSGSPSPRQSPEQHFPPEISVAARHNALHTEDIFQQDLSGHPVQQGPEGKREPGLAGRHHQHAIHEFPPWATRASQATSQSFCSKEADKIILH